MKYIAILRGINVSGQKVIKMAELKSLFESLGFSHVTTYIQSGNVIFSDGRNNIKKLKQSIEAAIENKYKFHVPVIIRTDNEWRKIMDDCPFGQVDLNNEGTKVLVTLLASKPNVANIRTLQQYVVLPEQLQVQGKEVYLYCPGGYGKSKLSNHFIEKKLALAATTRNWKTICKLHELSS